MANLKRRKIIKIILSIITITLIGWLVLTIFSQYYGEKKTVTLGNTTATKTAVIIYNPDPFYNLDEQVCKSFADGLMKYDFHIKLITSQEKPSVNLNTDLYVFCTNTYNWAPDWLVMNYIEENTQLYGKATVAITLGSGSTNRAKRILEQELRRKGSNLLASESYWLMRPNDEKQQDTPNADVANDMAKALGEKIGKTMSNQQY